jgi:sigma-B regulation protein RsbU (phosphoserine phosphatase)
MVEGLQHRDQLRHSLEVAMQVQQNLLPGADPAFAGLDIAGKSIYCDETGGDYYDYIEYPEQSGKIGLVIGDVSGHGISSALLMASARAFLRQRLALPGDISQAITDVNHQFSRDVAESGSFMSLFYLEIDRTDRCLNWVRCGHDPALLYHPSDGSITELKGSGVALGVDESYHFDQYRRKEINPGQIVVLGTDGIWEARDEAGEMFGKETLSRLVKENCRQSAGEILESIVVALENYRKKGSFEDDVTVIVAKVQENF